MAWGCMACGCMAWGCMAWGRMAWGRITWGLRASQVDGYLVADPEQEARSKDSKEVQCILAKACILVRRCRPAKGCTPAKAAIRARRLILAGHCEEERKLGVPRSYIVENTNSRSSFDGPGQKPLA